MSICGVILRLTISHTSGFRCRYCAGHSKTSVSSLSNQLVTTLLVGGQVLKTKSDLQLLLHRCEIKMLSGCFQLISMYLGVLETKNILKKVYNVRFFCKTHNFIIKKGIFWDNLYTGSNYHYVLNKELHLMKEIPLNFLNFQTLQNYRKGI